MKALITGPSRLTAITERLFAPQELAGSALARRSGPGEVSGSGCSSNRLMPTSLGALDRAVERAVNDLNREGAKLSRHVQ